MENQLPQNCSGYEIVAIEEDTFLFSNQLPLDFSYHPLNWQWEFPIQESMFEHFPIMESFTSDYLYSSMDISPNPTVIQDVCSESFEGFGVLDEVGVGLEPGKETVLSDNREGVEELMKVKKPKRCREEKNVSWNELSRGTISRFFYMPISQAAKELNVGLTLLKRRCRELGIPRWPHRKLMSLQTLIKNIQELAREEGDSKVRDEAVGMLEQERKLMEEMPGIELEEKTKKLRQACFKANYKKRKVMGRDDGIAVFVPYRPFVYGNVGSIM